MGREARNLRQTLIEEAEKNYVLSDDGKKLRRLYEEKEAVKERLTEAESKATEFAKSLGLTGVYNYTKAEDVLSQLKTKEIRKGIPEIDLEAALDDLIIESVEEEFSVDNFIEHYLKQMRNG